MTPAQGNERQLIERLLTIAGGARYLNHAVRADFDYMVSVETRNGNQTVHIPREMTFLVGRGNVPTEEIEYLRRQITPDISQSVASNDEPETLESVPNKPEPQLRVEIEAKKSKLSLWKRILKFLGLIKI